MSSFFAMGGYATYVWPAFGVTFVGLAAAILLTLVAYHRAVARLAALERK
ncbi:MAG TPA: heme exporter protein CcmD [Rhizomicrobium sp.]|jgi:heme exporter protein CcmD|nr:heme exporter protein CcmD [Rhizomicrobium sp.]